MPATVLRRETGTLAASIFQLRKAFERKLTLGYNTLKSIDTPGLAGITWLDLDSIEKRYLLAAAADGSVAAYDVLLPSTDISDRIAHHKPVFQAGRAVPGGHTYTVTNALWYPVDTGLFVTASFDERVQVWDSNAVQPVVSFQLGARVYSASMSPLAHAHALIAAGSGDPAVKLCDARTGGFTHILSGHREAVWATSWSLTSQWQLASGSCDGQVRVWDIRRVGCIALFGQHTTNLPRSMPAIQASDNQDTHQEAEDHDIVPPTAAATAHDGRVTAVLPTPDGLSWLTAGTDSRVRRWSIPTFRNTLVNYPNTHNRAIRARQLAVTDDAKLLFHPSGSVVQVFDLANGNLHTVLRGAHFESINCCTWNSEQQELYSGSNDLNIMVWSPAQFEQPPEVEYEIENDTLPADDDAWSED